MSIRCQSGLRIFRPNAQPGQVLDFNVNDLGISDDNGLNVFFGGSTGGNASPVIQRGDNVNNVTFFPSSEITGGFRSGGEITNDGNNIFFTVADTMEPGDCIMIEYTATNTQGNIDSDCTQTFEICFASEDANNTPTPPQQDNILDCVGGTRIQGDQSRRIDVFQIVPNAPGDAVFSQMFLFDGQNNAIPGVVLNGSSA